MNDGPGLLLIGRYTELRTIYLHHIQHMMGNSLHFLLGGFGGANVQASVDLDGICRDDLCAQAFGYLHP